MCQSTSKNLGKINVSKCIVTVRLNINTTRGINLIRLRKSKTQKGQMTDPFALSTIILSNLLVHIPPKFSGYFIAAIAQ